MKNSKLIIVVLICLISIILTGCNHQKELELNKPIFPKEINIHEVLNIELENDYRNIVAIPEKEIFNKDVEKIKVKILNNNVGKGFYIYSSPVIQFYKNKEWQNIGYFSDEIAQWLFIGVEDNKDEVNYTYFYIYPELFERKLQCGKYRISIFIPNDIIYAYFSIN